MRWLYVMEFFSSMYFIIPVWVSMELTHISLTQLTIIEVILSGSQLVLELPTGAFADLLGKKLTVFWGNIVTVVGMIAFAFANSFGGFVISSLFLGLGFALTSGAKEALLYDTLKQVNKEKSFDKIASRLNVVFQSGMAAATFLGGLLWLVDYKLPALASGGAVFLSALATLLVIEPLIDTETFTLQNYLRQTKQGFKEVFKTAYSTKLSLFYALVGGITFSASVVFSKLLFVEMGYSESEMGVFFAATRIFNSLVLFWLISKTKIFSFKTTILLFTISTPLMFLPGIMLTKFAVMPAVLAIMWVGSARWVLLGKYTNKIFSSKNRATAISSLSMMVSVIYIAIVLISGPVMEHLGGVRTLLSLMGILAVVGVLPLGLRVVEKTKTTQINIE